MVYITPISNIFFSYIEKISKKQNKKLTLSVGSPCNNAGCVAYVTEEKHKRTVIFNKTQGSNCFLLHSICTLTFLYNDQHLIACIIPNN